MRKYGPTLRERLARLETLMENHIHHHDARDKWMMKILGSLVVGVILLAVPGFWRWLGGLV